MGDISEGVACQSQDPVGPDTDQPGIAVVENHQKKAVVIDVAIPSDSQQHLEEGTREAREILKAKRRAGEYVRSEGSSGPRGNRIAWGSS